MITQTKSNPKLNADSITKFILQKLENKLGQLEKTSRDQQKTLENLKKTCETFETDLAPLRGFSETEEFQFQISISSSLKNYIKTNYLESQSPITQSPTKVSELEINESKLSDSQVFDQTLGLSLIKETPHPTMETERSILSEEKETPTYNKGGRGSYVQPSVSTTSKTPKKELNREL